MFQDRDYYNEVQNLESLIQTTEHLIETRKKGITSRIEENERLRDMVHKFQVEYQQMKRQNEKLLFDNTELRHELEDIEGPEWYDEQLRQFRFPTSTKTKRSPTGATKYRYNSNVDSLNNEINLADTATNTSVYGSLNQRRRSHILNIPEDHVVGVPQSVFQTSPVRNIGYDTAKAKIIGEQKEIENTNSLYKNTALTSLTRKLGLASVFRDPEINTVKVNNLNRTNKHR